MQPSALQLKRYFLSDISVTANKAYDPQAEQAGFRLSDVVAEPDCSASEQGLWQVVLRLRHTQHAESNTPYFFSLETVGIFGVDDVVPEEARERFVKCNGASVLFSTSREILRSVTANGPYVSLILPTISFYEEPES